LRLVGFQFLLTRLTNNTVGSSVESLQQWIETQTKSDMYSKLRVKEGS